MRAKRHLFGIRERFCIADQLSINDGIGEVSEAKTASNAHPNGVIGIDACALCFAQLHRSNEFIVFDGDVAQQIHEVRRANAQTATQSGQRGSQILKSVQRYPLIALLLPQGFALKQSHASRRRP